MTKPTVSFLVVNYNARKYIEMCLTSIFEQDYGEFDVVVVDNASTDGSLELVEKNYPDAKLIKLSSNRGFAAANNVGIKECSGDFLAFVNPDVRLHRKWASTLITEISESEGIGGGMSTIYYGGKVNNVFCSWPKIHRYTALPYNFPLKKPKGFVDYLSGAAMLLKREVISEVGLMDEDYFMYFEETDWCARMIRAGYRLLYTPETEAWHYVSATIPDTGVKDELMTRNRLRFIIKNFDYPYIFTSLSYFLFELATSIFFNSRGFRIKLDTLKWNISNFERTWQNRQRDFTVLKKNYGLNTNLPLKDVRGFYFHFPRWK